MNSLFYCLFLLVYFSIFVSRVQSESYGRIVAGRGNIVGGNYVTRGAFPWVAVLKKIDGLGFCGGSLLTSNKVLTAAHCIHGKGNAYKFTSEQITVTLGAHNLSIPDEIGRISVGVENIEVHRDWDIYAESFDADIAILTLSHSVEFSNYIQPVCLINPDTKAATLTSGYSVGYGKSEDNTTMYKDVLKYIQAPILNSNEECFYTNEALYKISSPRTFCGGTRGGAGVCMGDSGNGLFVEHNGIHYIRGIVSSSIMSHSNCDVQNYAVFTNVLKFNRWIKEKVYSEVNEDIYRHVTVWTPKKINSRMGYNFIVLPTNVDDKTEVSFEGMKNFGSIILSKKLQNVKFFNFDRKKRSTITITLYRNETNQTKPNNLCMTQTISVNFEYKEFFVQIQLDKPIYKPGDRVRFRVLTVDKYLRNFHINNIDIKIFDPANNKIFELSDLGGYFNGVITEYFDLEPSSVQGNYKIQVVVDKQIQRMKVKTFTVQQYNLPQFAAYIFLKEDKLLLSSFLELSFYAKYPSNKFVFGNAILKINCLTNNTKPFALTFRNIEDVQTLKLDISKTLKSTTSSKLEYKAEIIYKDQKTRRIATKSTRFTVYANINPKIIPHHPNKFMAGLPFGIKIFGYDWKDILIKESNELVRIVFILQLSSGRKKIVTENAELKNGLALHNYMVPYNAVELTLIIEYCEAYYEQKIDLGVLDVGFSTLAVDHHPKRPKVGDIVTIHINSDTELEQIIGVVMTKEGCVKTYEIHCLYNLNCEFDITINSDMIPQSTVVVYFIQSRQNIYRGETKIPTEEMSGNTLDIQLLRSPQINDEFLMKVETIPRSTVYFSVYDKRLTYLSEDNYLQKEDIIKEITDYDTENHVVSFHIEDLNWKECTQKELERIEKGRKKMTIHRKRAILSNDLKPGEEDEEELLKTALKMDEINRNYAHKRLKRSLNSFDSFEVQDGNITESFKFLNSSATLIVQSFSMNSKYGLVIGQPQEFLIDD